MKKDEWRITEELRRLNKYGIRFTARRSFEDQIGIYDIIIQNTEEIVEPSCSVEEILGIINVFVNVGMSLVIFHTRPLCLSFLKCKIFAFLKK